MKIPAALAAWLSAYGIAVESVQSLVDELADRIDAPDAWKQSIVAWLTQNATIGPLKAAAFVALLYAELTDPNPGYNPDHGGLV